MRNETIRLFLKIISIAAAIATVLGYAYFRSEALIAGPEIYVNSPTPGETLHDQSLTITGFAERTNAISLNGKKIFLDKEGVFNEEVLLHPGYNVILLKATDRFEKETVKRLEIIYQKT